MLNFFKYLFGVAGASVMALASISPQEAGSNLSAWAKVVGWESPPQWLTGPSADTWGFWFGAMLLLATFIVVTVPWLWKLLRQPLARPDMTAREAIEWLACKSKWAWRQRLAYSIR